MNKWPIQTRILSFFLIFLVFVAGLLLVTTLNAAFQHSNTQLAHRYDNTRDVLAYKFANDRKALHDAIDTASRDFSIKQLIASMRKDKESLLVALNNLARRAQASFVAVTDADFVIQANSRAELDFDVNITNVKNMHQFIRLSDEQLYLVAATPVKFLESQPNPNAWMIIGKRVDSLLADKTHTLTPFDTIILDERKVYANTHSNLELAIRLNGQVSNHSYRTLDAANEQYIVKGYPLTSGENNELTLFFASPSKTAYLDFQHISTRIAIEIALAIVVAIGVSLWIARSISRPMKLVEQAAKNIQQGDYQSKIPHFQAPEFNNLAVAFEQMQHGITQREKAIEHLAYNDELTALPNRNAYLKKLTQTITNATETESFTVVLIDLDRFKVVNDTIGHEAGDKLLRAVGSRLASLNIEQTFVAYLGGDEFALILPMFDKGLLSISTDLIVNIFESPFRINGVYLDVKASIGVARYPDDADSAQKLLQYADIALYEAKSGHSVVEYYKAEFNHYSVQRLNLMSELRLAIEENHLSLYYQPKLCVAANKIVSVESLVRWIHPTHGFVGPDDFIPLAEQTGAIRALTKWVIGEALRQQSIWSKQGYDLQVSVNISAHDLVDLQLVALISNLLSKYQVPPKQLKIEVTESAIMTDARQAIETLNVLKNLGIKLSIDDFGTGYSSMAQLRDMPVDELKIDKSFVMDLPENVGNKKIVSSTVGLAHSLGLTVVAEGVETKEGLDFLKSLDVEYLQGYYIAKPLPADDFLHWLKEKSTL